MDISIAASVMILLLLHMTGMAYKKELDQLFPEYKNMSKDNLGRVRTWGTERDVFSMMLLKEREEQVEEAPDQ